MADKKGFSTRAIHDGQEPDPQTGAVTVPIYQTSTFAQEGIGKNKGWEYSRSGNPTRAALETNLASLENGKFGLAFASGLAAESTVMHLLKSGDHVVTSFDVYGGTFRLFDKVFRNFGISFTYVDATDPKNIESAITSKTKLVWLESPTNPLLKLADIGAISKITKKRKVLLAVDNTFMSPYFQNPLDLGADIVVHSTTKYLGGHSDLIGGAIVVNDKNLYEQLKFFQNAVGGVPGILECWLLLRSVKTLAVRMREHEKNAFGVAQFLEFHPKVVKVNYPGLLSHPQQDLAKKQMRGFGGMMSFELKADLEAAKKFVEYPKIFTFGESLGGVESLIGHPATQTHAAIPREERLKIGISDGLIRLSIGIENLEDLIADLKQALAKLP